MASNITDIVIKEISILISTPHSRYWKIRRIDERKVERRKNVANVVKMLKSLALNTMVSRWFLGCSVQLIPSRLISIIYYHRSVIISFKLLKAQQAREQRNRSPIIYNYPNPASPLSSSVVTPFYSHLMDALARQTSGVNFSFNAFLPILALISPTLQGSACPVGEANFNASEKGQTWPYYFADHFAPVRETPQDITTPPLPPLHSPSLRHIDPIPRCTGLPYPQVFEFETRARFSIEG